MNYDLERALLQLTNLEIKLELLKREIIIGRRDIELFQIQLELYKQLNK
jgi:hypothetical protein